MQGTYLSRDYIHKMFGHMLGGTYMSYVVTMLGD